MNRKEHWERVYREKEVDSVSWYQSNPEVSLDLISSCKLDCCQHIIDVGAGSSILVDRLIELEYQNLHALDISSAALQNSIERLGKFSERVNWIIEDITNFQTDLKFQLWHDRAVFHFLTEKQDRAQYIETLHQAILTGGNLILASFDLDGPEKCSGLPIVQYNEEKIQDEIGSGFKLIESKKEIHLTPWQSEQSFKYFRFMRI